MNRTPLAFATMLFLFASALAACSSDEGPEPAAENRATAGQTDREEQPHEAEDGNAHGEEGDEHGDEHGHDEHGEEESEPDFARIDPKTAAQHGIELAQATSGTVAESIPLTGRLIIDPRRIALVRARFPGPVRNVANDVGEAVRKGDVLAQVESNESLTVYDVRSPIAGVVLERMTNVGDVAGSDALFRVGDLSSLQAELKVFSNDRSRIERGAEAIVRIGDQEVPGEVISLLPEIESRTQAMLVRITLNPSGPLHAAPGQFVTGQVLVGRREAAVAVPADAVQRFEGREVIFVPEKEGFRARVITVGQRSLDRLEITEGLRPGERYVVAGAFLVKAEIGKNMAGHDH